MEQLAKSEGLKSEATVSVGNILAIGPKTYESIMDRFGSEATLAKEILANFKYMVEGDSGLLRCSKESLLQCLANFLKLREVPDRNGLYMRVGYGKKGEGKVAMIQDDYLYTKRLVAQEIGARTISAEVFFKSETEDVYNALKGCGTVTPRIDRDAVVKPDNICTNQTYNNAELIICRAVFGKDDFEQKTYTKKMLESRQGLDSEKMACVIKESDDKETTYKPRSIWFSTSEHNRLEMLKKAALRAFCKDLCTSGTGKMKKLDAILAKQEEGNNEQKH